MFSHVARELGAHHCIGSRASDPASEQQDLGGARVIAATAINAEVPISTETISRSIETKGAQRAMSVPAVPLGRSVAHRIVSRVVLSPLGRRFGRDIASRLDPTLIRLTRGRVSSVWPFPAVVMTHVGAKSGRTRTSALVYFTDRGRVILIASNFGGSRNPGWYHNVKANPIVMLYGRGIRGRFIAEEIYGAERDRVFQRAKDAPGPYRKYEQAAATRFRCVPVIAFTPQSCGCVHAVVDRGH
jgi:deazaflavin-dependent oxidoreductase (nitroreductase family)